MDIDVGPQQQPVAPSALPQPQLQPTPPEVPQQPEPQIVPPVEVSDVELEHIPPHLRETLSPDERLVVKEFSGEPPEVIELLNRVLEFRVNPPLPSFPDTPKFDPLTTLPPVTTVNPHPNPTPTPTPPSNLPVPPALPVPTLPTPALTNPQQQRTEVYVDPDKGEDVDASEPIPIFYLNQKVTADDTGNKPQIYCGGRFYNEAVEGIVPGSRGDCFKKGLQVGYAKKKKGK